MRKYTTSKLFSHKWKQKSLKRRKKFCRWKVNMFALRFVIRAKRKPKPAKFKKFVQRVVMMNKTILGIKKAVERVKHKRAQRQAVFIGIWWIIRVRWIIWLRNNKVLNSYMQQIMNSTSRVCADVFQTVTSAIPQRENPYVNLQCASSIQSGWLQSGRLNMIEEFRGHSIDSESSEDNLLF